MKIAIYSDSLMQKAGGTRVAIELANSLNADIITSGYNKDINKWLPIKNKVIDIGNISGKYSTSFNYFFESPLRFLFCKDYGYDLNIFCGIFTFYASHKNKKNIWFCLTPNRLLYDLKNWKLANASFLNKMIFQLHILMFSKIDKKYVKSNINQIIAQTDSVKARIKKYYGKNSETIYSPVNTKKYKFSKNGDFYLAVSRLMEEKRMDLIANAFTKMPDKKLILVGQGPEEKKILSIIKGHNNISLLSNISEQELINFYSTCFAVIYMPIEEDFGLVPIEAMASGKICIAADEAGCRETILNEKTGYLIKATEENIIDTVKSLKIETLLRMKNDCILRANDFDISSITEKWKELIYK